MRKRRKLIWILTGCGIGAVICIWLWCEREPRCEGRSLSEWVWMLENGTSHTNAEAAIEHIGLDAVPFLAKWIDYRERPWRRRLSLLCYKLPPKFADQLSRFVMGHGYERQQGAYSALAILGPKAKGAVPALRRQVENPSPYVTTFSGYVPYGAKAPRTVFVRVNDPYALYIPLSILAKIGEEGVPCILDVVRNPANPNRAAAVSAVAQLEPKLIFTENVASALISCLDDTNHNVAFFAGGILCSHKLDQEVVLRVFAAALQANDAHIRSEAALPIRLCLMEGFSVRALLQFLQDTNSPFSADAAAVLGEMVSNGIDLPEAALPALAGSLHDPRPSVRSCAVGAIGCFREAAEPVVSALLDAWNDPDRRVRQFATNAFFQIPAYVVLKDATLIDNISTEPARTKWIHTYFNNAPGPELARLFEHRDPRIRELATNAFHKFSAASLQAVQKPEDTQTIFKH